MSTPDILGGAPNAPQWVDLREMERAYECSVCGAKFVAPLDVAAPWLAITVGYEGNIFFRALDEFMNAVHRDHSHPDRHDTVVSPLDPDQGMRLMLLVMPGMPDQTPPSHLPRETFEYVPIPRNSNIPARIPLLAVWDSRTLAGFREKLTR